MDDYGEYLFAPQADQPLLCDSPETTLFYSSKGIIAPSCSCTLEELNRSKHLFAIKGKKALLLPWPCSLEEVPRGLTSIIFRGRCHRRSVLKPGTVRGGPLPSREVRRARLLDRFERCRRGILRNF